MWVRRGPAPADHNLGKGRICIDLRTVLDRVHTAEEEAAVAAGAAAAAAAPAVFQAVLAGGGGKGAAVGPPALAPPPGLEEGEVGITLGSVLTLSALRCGLEAAGCRVEVGGEVVGCRV